MLDSRHDQLLADLVLALHFAVVAFVVGGVLFIVVGNRMGWRRANAWGFRLTHLMAIGFVVAEAWLGATCPLTTLESWLRSRAQTASYSRSFIEHWVQRLLYFEAPPWFFALGYTLFGVLVLALWLRFPPKSAQKPADSRADEG